MGRFKFPGKPPKTVTRKRIKVLGGGSSELSLQKDSVIITENTNNHGNSLLNNTSGDHDKVPSLFDGSKDTKLSFVKSQKNEQSTIGNSSATDDVDKNENDSSKACENNDGDAVANDDNDDGDEDNDDDDDDDEEDEVEEDNDDDDDDDDDKMMNGKSKNSKTIPTVLKRVNNILNRNQRTRQLRNSTAKRLLQRAKFNINTNNRNNGNNNSNQTSDKTSTIRKFVLPIRSAHSSRVIKPNKRFIEELEIKKTTSTSHDLINNRDDNKKIININKKNSTKKLNKTIGKNNNFGIINNERDLKINNKSKKIVLETKKLKSKDTLFNKNLKRNSNNKIKLTANKNTNMCSKNFKLTDEKEHLNTTSGVLPDSNTSIIIESSRIQTRSETSSEYLRVQNLQKTNQSTSENNKTINDQDSSSTTQQNRLNITDENQLDLSSDSSQSESKSDEEQSEWTGVKLDGGKIILRKARLKLENKTETTEGPFSVINPQNTSINSNSTGTVKCGVCGAVRFYRFVKQARKFGIHSCESCRKFISKMIKRQAHEKSGNDDNDDDDNNDRDDKILVCNKGDGMCLVPPVVRSQQWNLMRCVYKTRCLACWLKMCLKCYNIPSTLRTGLNSLLPASMRDDTDPSPMPDVDNGDTTSYQKSIGSQINWPGEESLEKNLFKSTTSWSDIRIGNKFQCQNNTESLISLNKYEQPLTSNKRKKDSWIKMRKKIKNPSLQSSIISPASSPPTATSNQSSQISRQRVDLKGPRVKHVCRSASVALGQPIATFSTSDLKEEPEISIKSVPKTRKELEKSEKTEKPLVSIEKDNSQKTNNVETSISNNYGQLSYTKRTKNQYNLTTSNQQLMRGLSKQAVNEIHKISIDFWEQYDPVEVGAKGFALVGTDPFHIPAICFLCGSAGKEPLIHCQCCVEPYHAFCLEPSEWNACAQANWSCPRCTICQTCNLRAGTKLSCIRCRQSFHHACLSKSGLNARLYSPDRPYICQSCVKCKSCGSEGVSVYVGNLPLCSICFKLRQRGNYCPLCQRCYNENDFDSKMMECNECSCWVHARCEKLSDEYYQVLSYLPDSIEFTCRQCSPDPNSIWRNAIETEIKNGFIAVIKALSKNRKMSVALNWSPRKECLCKSSSSSSTSISSMRKLDLYEGKFGRELAEEFDDNYDKKIVKTVDNKVVDPLSRFDFEIDEQPVDFPRRGLRRLKQKYHLKECSVRVKNCIPKYNSQDERSSSDTLLSNNSTDSVAECQCSDQQIIARPSSTLMSIKRKVNDNEYQSLFQFYWDMEHVVSEAGSEELVQSYHKSLQEVFPWFDPTQPVSSSGENEFTTPTKNSTKDPDSPMSKLNCSILETWKEEVLKAPKAIAAKAGNIYSNNIAMEDMRHCVLCKGLGDGLENKEGRLLYCGQNDWVHSNCALWSNEVFEEIDGSLQNVQSAISRGRLIRCCECGKKGASVGCCAKNCTSTYHFPCARNINIGFNSDKTILCTIHMDNNEIEKNQNLDYFDLRRLVYVELDKKKKKLIEPEQIKVMIGSLTIESLGTISPEFSSTVEKIIPINYKCSRLYWSTVNPMKIVRYYIKTFVQTSTTETIVNTEHNITIDHLKEIEKEKKQELEKLAVRQTLDAIIDSVYNKEIDENLAEQNNTDLLPPDITDVIFEDLPHDILDGISMQDIFQKMSYEDFLVMDLKRDGSLFGNDLLKEEILTTTAAAAEIDEIIKPSDSSKINKLVDPSISELTSSNDLWLHLETKGSVQDLVDDILNSRGQKKIVGNGRELKRSKSEVIGNNSLIVGSQRHHQRSCSLTWSCKVDGTYGPTVKRRKLPTRTTPVSIVESQNEKSSSLFHEIKLPESIMMAVGRASTPSIINENKDHKRLVWHTRQQPRILQVDGAADTNSECSSPECNIEDRIPQIDGEHDESSCNSTNWFTKFSKNNNDTIKSDKIPQLDGADDISSDDENSRIDNSNIQGISYIQLAGIKDGPVMCKRCQCTYRTHDSYNRHLGNCDIVTTSDSDSETIDNRGLGDACFSTNIDSSQLILMSPSQGQTLSSDYSNISVTSPLEASLPSPHHSSIPIEPISQALVGPQIHGHSTVETLHQTVLTSNDMIVQTQYTRTMTTLPNQSVLSTSGQSENTIQISDVTDGLNDNNKLSNGNNNVTMPKIIKNKVSRTVKPRAKIIKPQVTRNIIDQQHQQQQQQQQQQHHQITPLRYQTIQNATPVQLQLQQIPQIQQAQRQTPSTVILQQVPQTGIMSAYVDPFQQQAGQNVQYITAIGGQEQNYEPQYITTNQLVPGAAYIQTGTENLLALPNGGISVLPSVQIAQSQPTVLGTIIQQQPSTIQCGVISSEQLVLSSTPATLEMFTDSTGSMFVSNQPMYYGLETIVSNTIMSSSQFMTGAMPQQVLASSYQTTTQVFQASKLVDPIVDVQTGTTTMPSVTNVPTMSSGQTTSVTAVQNIPGMPNIPGGYVVVNPSSRETMTGTNIPMASNEQMTFVRQACNSGPVVEPVRPIQQQQTVSKPVQHTSISSIPRVAVRPSPVSSTLATGNQSQWKITESSTYSIDQNTNSAINTRPYLDSKHVSENTSMIKSSLSSKIPPLSRQCLGHKDLPMTNNITVNNSSSIYTSGFPNGNLNCNSIVSGDTGLNKNYSSVPLTRPMNRVLPMQAVHVPKQEIKPVQKNEVEREETRKIIDIKAFSPEPIKLMDIIEEKSGDVDEKIEDVGGDKFMDVEEKFMDVEEKSMDDEEKFMETVEKLMDIEAKTMDTEEKIMVIEEKFMDIQDMIEEKKCIVEQEPFHFIEKPSQVDEKQKDHSVVEEERTTIDEEILTTENDKPIVLEEEKEKEEEEELPPVCETSVEKEDSLPIETQQSTATKVESPVSETIESPISDDEESKENLNLPIEKDDLQKASLKIVLQKQLQDGSYKITQNIKSVSQNSNKPKNLPKITSMEILPPKQTPQIGSLKLLPIKPFTLKTTDSKIDDKTCIINKNSTLPEIKNIKLPPVAVKKPRLTERSTNITENLPPKNEKPLSINKQNSENIIKNKKGGSKLMYEIKSQDGFCHTASSMAEVWETVFNAVQNARKAHNMPPLAHNPLSEDLGLENNATVYLVEQLAGVNRCTKYKPKYHNLTPPTSPDTDVLTESIYGAARAGPFSGRKVHDMFSWLASKHRQQPHTTSIPDTEIRRAASTNLPMAMRFRILKETSKESVGVYHSHIHGRGLFCLRDIEAGEMVIEYAGEVIRASLTDKREKYYDSKHIGCYMFKIDDHLVVDATMKGNAARFINHSCEPNCYSRVVDILGKKHILIFALRRIIQGEELTYDYKFPFEDVKIPCTCGSRKCRKYLN